MLKELFLGLLTLGKKVDVVDDENFSRSEPRAKFAHSSGLHPLNEVIDEAAARDVADRSRGSLSEDLLGDRLEQVCLSEADTTVNKDGVVSPTGMFGNGKSGGMSKPVARADNEVVERIVGAQEHLFGQMRGECVFATISARFDRQIGSGGDGFQFISNESNGEKSPRDRLGSFRGTARCTLVEGIAAEQARGRGAGALHLRHRVARCRRTNDGTSRGGGVGGTPRGRIAMSHRRCIRSCCGHASESSSVFDQVPTCDNEQYPSALR